MRAKQIQILMVESLYPDIREVIKEIRAWARFTTNAQAVAFALRELRNKLARQRELEKRRKGSSNG